MCVAAYERPVFLDQLVLSVVTQTYSPVELWICDDSRSDAVERVARSWQQHSLPIALHYSRNTNRLGFQRNLETVLRKASGDITVVLGDDDLLATPYSLAAYAAAAKRYPDAAFLYPNLLQIDEYCNRTAVHRYFQRDSYCSAGTESLAGPWLRSVQIAGMGFSVPGGMVADLFPPGPALFPQVVAVGQLLLEHGSLGINDYLVATRVTGSQLGYEVARGRSVFGDRQRLGAVELLDIVADMRSRSRAAIEPVAGRLERRIFVDFVLSEPNIRVFSGRRALSRLALSFAAHCWHARRSPGFWVVTVGLWVAPAWFVRVTVATLKAGWRRIRRVQEVPLMTSPRAREAGVVPDLAGGWASKAGLIDESPVGPWDSP